MLCSIHSNCLLVIWAAADIALSRWEAGAARTNNWLQQIRSGERRSLNYVEVFISRVWMFYAVTTVVCWPGPVMGLHAVIDLFCSISSLPTPASAHRMPLQIMGQLVTRSQSAICHVVEANLGLCQVLFLHNLFFLGKGWLCECCWS